MVRLLCGSGDSDVSSAIWSAKEAMTKANVCAGRVNCYSIETPAARHMLERLAASHATKAALAVGSPALAVVSHLSSSRKREHYGERKMAFVAWSVAIPGPVEPISAATVLVDADMDCTTATDGGDGMDTTGPGSESEAEESEGMIAVCEAVSPVEVSPAHGQLVVAGPGGGMVAPLLSL
jgi:hypothetical protein